MRIDKRIIRGGLTKRLPLDHFYSGEILADICLVVILLSHADEYRTVRLFGLLNDLITGAVLVHDGLVMRNFLMVYFEKLFAGQAQIIFLRENERLKNAG